jgi:hypothetical protein
MSKSILTRLPEKMRKLLTTSREPWHIEIGGRHFKLKIGNRLVAILPRGGNLSGFHGRADKNAMANIKRAIREQGEG